MKRYEHRSTTQQVIEDGHGRYADPVCPESPSADPGWRLAAVIPSPWLENYAVFYWERELRDDE